ncbi:GNAT family N-acetyltransferase [uncultured Modestobacter sp.]|uniref:GNAT family N-acetyltransferase n=1 Tax=uncultured Modestobacter sp. TaxID=380048 RepID=UPI00262FA447|nr:GNAT family N-acetyltransferase [uncultured Modestobacter sp.]
MQITVVRPHELGEPELQSWRDFQQATPAYQHPFLAPEFSVVVGRHRPQARVAVLVDGSKTVGFFPFEHARGGVGGPIARNMTACQGLVHAPGAEWDVDRLLRACGLSVWEFDCLVEGQEPFESASMVRVPSPLIDLSDGFPAYLEELRQRAPSTHKKLGQRRRRFERAFEDACFAGDTQDSAQLRTLMSWKSDQYRRTGRSDRSTWTGVPEILDELLHTRTATFSGVLSAVHGGGELAAAAFLLVSHGTAAGWHAGFNRAFSAYSPGMLVQLAAAEHLAGVGVTELHMGPGTLDVYKQTLKSRDAHVGAGRVLRRTPAGALHWARSAATGRARQFVTASPRLLKAADATLQRYGRITTSLSRRSGRTDGPAVAP